MDLLLGNVESLGSLGKSRVSGAVHVQNVKLAQRQLGDLKYLAWSIPGTGEPGGLQSMESLRVGHY